MDGTENQQDVNTSADTQGTSEQTKTYTEEEVRKVRSDALAELGRYKQAADEAVKAAERAKSNADAVQTRLDRFLKEQDEAELSAARDNPDRLTQLRETQRRRDAEAKAEKLERELNDAREKANEMERQSATVAKERNAREIAEREKVDVKSLLDFTDGSTDKMEALAKILPKVGEAAPPAPNIKIDSGVTHGGGLQGLTAEKLAQRLRAPDGLQWAKEHEKEIDELHRGGKLK